MQAWTLPPAWGTVLLQAAHQAALTGRPKVYAPMMSGHLATLSKYRLLARLGSGGMAEVYLVLSESPGGFNKLQVLELMRSDRTQNTR